MTKLKYLPLSLLPLAGLGLWASRTQPAAAEQRTQPADRVIVAPAHVEPERDVVALAFEAQGRIASIVVDEGTAVKAGDVIATLDARLATARVAAAEANVAQAAARLAMARRGPRGEDLAAARAEATAAEVEAVHRAREHVRSAHLGETGVLASSIVDADEAIAGVARARAAAAAARYQAVAHGTRVEQLDEAAAILAAARAELDAAKVALDQLTLRAPADGLVLRRTAEIGQLVTLVPPPTIVTLADVRHLEVRAELDEADVAVVAVGQLAYATADAFGDRHFPIRITRITNELGRRAVRDDDPRARIDTRVLEVIATFAEDPGVKLPIGLRMSVHLGR
ncbi:MAG: efflux RND transporter periplasmic adaptor subunit [Proteobacteria bacterium]|nr:efflux RND transporter periplasmic adaptor subunit [Pseudomonadota bacterium]